MINTGTMAGSQNAGGAPVNAQVQDPVWRSLLGQLAFGSGAMGVKEKLFQKDTAFEALAEADGDVPAENELTDWSARNFLSVELLANYGQAGVDKGVTDPDSRDARTQLMMKWIEEDGGLTLTKADKIRILQEMLKHCRVLLSSTRWHTLPYAALKVYPSE